MKNQIRSIDLLPTILEILSIPMDSNYKPIDGKSLMPIINGSHEERIAFSQSGNPLQNKQPPKEPNVFSIRTDKWKFISNVHDNSEELYDLENDVHEEINVIEQNHDVASELRLKLKKILMESNYP